MAISNAPSAEKISRPLCPSISKAPAPHIGKYLVPVFILLGIVAAFTATHFLMSADKTPPPAKIVAPVVIPPSSSPLPVQEIAAAAPQATLPAPQVTDKMQIVERIAAGFHKSHTYTLRVTSSVWTWPSTSGTN